MAPSATTSRADLRRLAGELVGSPGRFVGICVSGVLSATIEAALLVIVVEVAVGLSETGRRVSFDVPMTDWTMSIGPILTLAIALATAKIAAGWWGARLTAAMSTDVLVRLRTELYDAFAHASWSRQSTERLGTLQELLGGHCRQASAAVRFGAAAIFSAVNFAILVVVAILVEPTAALLILAAVVLLYLLLRPLTRAAYNAAKESSDSQVAYANLTVELSDLAEEVTVFGVGGTAASAVEAELARTAAPHYRSELMARLLPELYTSTSLLVIVGALAIVAAIDGAGLASLGVVVVLLVRALTRAQGTQNSWHRLIEFLPYTDRVLVHREELRAAREDTAGRPLDRLEAFGLDHVSFAYGDEGVVLDDVSMEVRQGEALGIIGPSGGGKTTLVELLLRLRLPTSGQVLVNGEDAASWDRADFNRRIGFVPQEPRLITASVADNIRFFRPDITDEAIERAASLARLDDEIEVLEAGYDTVVSERGRGLSGGQRQRLCLARALAGDPQVLVLDEPTSALDARSEELLRASLSTLVGGLTVVLVAHRPATLAICERVLVLTDGRVEALAPVAELAEVNAFYRDATARS